MLITDEIFQAFLQCETKSYLKLSGAVGDQREFSDWERNLVEDYKRKCHRQLCADFREAECLVGVAFPQDLENSRCRLVMDCRMRAQEMQSHLHAVERLVSPGTTNHSPYMPLRCVPREKITKQDKLLLAFDALALCTVSGQAPPFGKIIHGREQATAKVELAGWMDMAKTVIGKIAAQHASHTPPPLILNQHCAACEFKARCRQIALEKDELSLLAGMTEKERKQQHNEDNREIARRRVRIEQVNSSVKRCRMLKETIRMWKDGMRDMVMEIGCALHNLRVRCTPSWTPMV